MAGSGKAHLRNNENVILRVEDLTMEFPAGRKKVVRAVSGISFDIERGETLAIVGESGCGKSTLGKAILQLPKPTSGSVNFQGQELTTLNKDALGKACIIYFYPKDFTKVCTAEACDFRDQFAAFRDLDIPVFGISRDSIDTHLKFKKEFNEFSNSGFERYSLEELDLNFFDSLTKELFHFLFFGFNGEINNKTSCSERALGRLSFNFDNFSLFKLGFAEKKLSLLLNKEFFFLL